MLTRVVAVLCLLCCAYPVSATASAPLNAKGQPSPLIGVGAVDRPLLQKGAAEIPADDLIYDTDSDWEWRDPTYWINWGAGLQEVASPFWSPLEGLEDLDYEPEDGWVLMAKEFGGVTGPATPAPFFILYNRYRATIRFVIYLHDTNENYSWGRVTLRFAASSTKTKSVRNRSLLLPLSKHPYNDQVSVITLQQGWNYADFTVGYDPGTGGVLEPLFVFEVDGVSENTIALDGESETETVSMGVTDLNKSPFGFLDVLIGGVNKANKRFGNTEKSIGELEKNLLKLQNEDHAYIFANLILALQTHQPFIAGFTAAAGFLEHVLGTKKKDNEPTITKSNSHMTLSGTMRAVEQVTQVLLRVPGANHNGKPNALPIYNQRLGLFAILDHPTTGYATSTTDYSEPCVPCGSYPAYFSYLDILQLDGSIPYSVNGASGLRLKSLDAAWSFSVPHPENTGPPGYWDMTPPYYVEYLNQLVDEGHYTIIGSADNHGNNFYEYRTQFVDIREFHLVKAEVSRMFWYTEPWKSLGQPFTAPVMVRATFEIPGRSDEYDVIVVESYDLWWPEQIPEIPPGWIPPAVDPKWNPLTPPIVQITNPHGNSYYETMDEVTIRWRVTGPRPEGSFTNLSLAIDYDDPQNYRSVFPIVDNLRVGWDGWGEYTWMVPHGSIVGELGLIDTNRIQAYTWRGVFGNNAFFETDHFEITYKTKPGPDPPPDFEIGPGKPGPRFVSDGVYFSQPAPNPSASNFAFGFSLASAAPVTLKVYDVRGRVVRAFHDGEHVDAGQHTVLWDGRSQGGRSVAQGVYFIRFSANGGSTTSKVVLAR